MVADDLQQDITICHNTVADVADGFQRMCNRNTLIFKHSDTRDRYGRKHREKLALANQSIHQGVLFSPPKRMKKSAKAHSLIRQGELDKS